VCSLSAHESLSHIVIPLPEQTENNSVSVFHKGLGESFPRLNLNQIRFLAAFSVIGIVNEACKASGINRSTHSIWLADPEYRKAFEYCKIAARETVEAEVRRRAVDGWDDPVFFKGIKVGTIRRYSDTLAQFYLKGLDPERFGDRLKHDVTAKQGDSTPLDISIAEVLSPEELADLQARLQVAARAKQAKLTASSAPSDNMSE
jgi:hypothetical protein